MQKQEGLIKLIILIIIAIFVLSFFGISIRSLIEGESFQENFNYVLNVVKSVWQKYLAESAKYLWNDIFIDLIWNSFIENLEKIKGGGPSELIENAPSLDFASPSLAQ